MPKKSQASWDRIKAAYLTEFAETGNCDLIALGKRFKVVYGTLRNRVSSEGWGDEARGIKQSVEEKIRDEVVPKIVSARVKNLQEQLEYTQYIRKKAMGVLVKAEVNFTPAQAQKAVFDAMAMETKLLAQLDDTQGSKDDARGTVDMFKEFVAQLSTVDGDVPDTVLAGT